MDILQTIASIIVATVALVSLCLSIKNTISINRQEKDILIFISIMVKDLTDDEYINVRESTLGMIEDVKAMKRVKDVYCYNEDIEKRLSTYAGNFDVNKYMKKLDECDYFIAIISKRIHSSIFFEAGYALAKNKQCIYFIKKNIEVLPSLMKMNSEVNNNIRVIQFDEIEEIKNKLNNIIPKIKL